MQIPARAVVSTLSVLEPKMENVRSVRLERFLLSIWTSVCSAKMERTLRNRELGDVSSVHRARVLPVTGLGVSVEQKINENYHDAGFERSDLLYFVHWYFILAFIASAAVTLYYHDSIDTPRVTHDFNVIFLRANSL